MHVKYILWKNHVYTLKCLNADDEMSIIDAG